MGRGCGGCSPDRGAGPRNGQGGRIDRACSIMRRKVPLRAQATLENRLWMRLRQMEGYRFRRKSPFRTFTLDFVEHEAGLVISLEDGEPGRRSTAIVRDRLLNEQG